jgi:hypothetical protein
MRLQYSNKERQFVLKRPPRQFSDATAEIDEYSHHKLKSFPESSSKYYSQSHHGTVSLGAMTMHSV